MRDARSSRLAAPDATEPTATAVKWARQSHCDCRHTTTSSWDDWAQGFYPGTNKPYMSCPGQGRDTGTAADLFFFTLFNQPDYLDLYNSQHNGGTLHTVPFNSQFKCYDGMHNWNQVQPAPYDGMYQFPSIIGRNPTTGAPVGSGSVNGTPGTRPGSNQ